MKAKRAVNSQPAPEAEREAAEETKSLTERRKEWQHVGDQLATVLADPSTPAKVYNGLVEAIDELANEHDLCLTHPVILRAVYPILAEIHEDGRYNGPAFDCETTEELYKRLASTIWLVLVRTDVPRKLKMALIKFHADLGGEVEGNMDCQATEVRHTLPLICRALAGKKGGK